MKTNGGFLVTKIKQLGDRIFEKILSEKNIDAFNGAQGRILFLCKTQGGVTRFELLLPLLQLTFPDRTFFYIKFYSSII